MIGEWRIDRLVVAEMASVVFGVAVAVAAAPRKWPNPWWYCSPITIAGVLTSATVVVVVAHDVALDDVVAPMDTEKTWPNPWLAFLPGVVMPNCTWWSDGR